MRKRITGIIFLLVLMVVSACGKKESLNEISPPLDLMDQILGFQPVIGISWRSDEMPEKYETIAEALRSNGASVVFLPEMKDELSAKKALKEVDGILMTGGEDYNPMLYGEEQAPHGSAKWNSERDSSDQILLKMALDEKTPFLAICRNCQGLNIVTGGGLIQDIPLYLGEKVQKGEIDTTRVTTVLSGTLSNENNVQDKGYRVYDKENDSFSPSFDKKTGLYSGDMNCC